MHPKSEPGWVVVKTSTFLAEGLGVFADYNFEKGQILGKYQGKEFHCSEWKKYEKTQEKTNTFWWCYILEIKRKHPETKRKRTYFIDACDDSCSNWTKYINHFPKGKKANCIFTEDGHVKTLCKIKKEQELFIDYGSDYWESARDIGITLL